MLAETHCENVLTSARAGATELGVLPAASRMRERLRLQRGRRPMKSCTHERLLGEARENTTSEEKLRCSNHVSNLEQRAADGDV